MGVSIRVDVKDQKVRGAMRLFAKRQLPFAGSRAINRTMSDAAKAGRRDLGRKFKLRNRGGNLGVQFRPTNKRDWEREGAAIRWREYLAQHEKGGKIRPDAGRRAFAIPTRVVAAQRTRGGKIRSGFRPRPAISAGKAVVEIRDRRGVIAKAPLKRRSRRKVRRGGRLRLWFLLRRTVVLRPVLKAEDAVRPTIRARYPRYFRIEMARAIRSGR